MIPFDIAPPSPLAPLARETTATEGFVLDPSDPLIEAGGPGEGSAEKATTSFQTLVAQITAETSGVEPSVEGQAGPRTSTASEAPSEAGDSETDDGAADPGTIDTVGSLTESSASPNRGSGVPLPAGDLRTLIVGELEPRMGEETANPVRDNSDDTDPSVPRRVRPVPGSSVRPPAHGLDVPVSSTTSETANAKEPIDSSETQAKLPIGRSGKEVRAAEATSPPVGDAGQDEASRIKPSDASPGTTSSAAFPPQRSEPNSAGTDGAWTSGSPGVTTMNHENQRPNPRESVAPHEPLESSRTVEATPAPRDPAATVPITTVTPDRRPQPQAVAPTMSPEPGPPAARPNVPTELPSLMAPTSRTKSTVSVPTSTSTLGAAGAHRPSESIPMSSSPMESSIPAPPGQNEEGSPAGTNANAEKRSASESAPFGRPDAGQSAEAYRSSVAPRRTPTSTAPEESPQNTDRPVELASTETAKAGSSDDLRSPLTDSARPTELGAALPTPITPPDAGPKPTPDTSVIQENVTRITRLQEQSEIARTRANTVSLRVQDDATGEEARIRLSLRGAELAANIGVGSAEHASRLEADLAGLLRTLRAQGFEPGFLKVSAPESESGRPSTPDRSPEDTTPEREHRRGDRNPQRDRNEALEREAWTFSIDHQSLHQRGEG